jgi:hypothetical protein
MLPRGKPTAEPAGVLPGCRKRRKPIVLILIKNATPPMQWAGQFPKGKKEC